MSSPLVFVEVRTYQIEVMHVVNLKTLVFITIFTLMTAKN